MRFYETAVQVGLVPGDWTRRPVNFVNGAGQGQKANEAPRLPY
ncbi:hypothetical protein [Streptomyces sp. NBC_01092]|nr:hypothetical protein OG254_23760 [Streptomyces sp. NBC_01092]